jgi:hypothetical protein
MVDGARMLSPGVLRLTLDALRIDPRAAVAVPGYHLGDVPQQQAVDAGYGEAEERALLERIDWPRDGYRLFEIAALSESSREGFVLPSPESNFLALARSTWHALGGMDPRYDDDGGYANHDLYKRVLEHPGTRCFMLFGEGSFHQYHGGATTGTPAAERQQICERIVAQDLRLRGANCHRTPPCCSAACTRPRIALSTGRCSARRPITASAVASAPGRPVSECGSLCRDDEGPRARRSPPDAASVDFAPSGALLRGQDPQGQ